MEKNKLILKGHLGAKPEVFTKENGLMYSRLSIAINNFKKLDDGSYENTSTDWFNVTCFNSPRNLASRVTVLEKGDLVRIEGRLTTSNYEKSGVEIKGINIVATDVDKIEPMLEKTSAMMLNHIDKALNSVESVNA